MENEQILLIESLAALLDEKPFDAISARMVTDRASLPASTFGYFYHDIYELAHALFEAEERAVEESRITPSAGSEAFILSVSFAIRHPTAARNICRSSASGIYKRHVAALASKYFSAVILSRLGGREPGDRERDEVRFLRAAAVGLASKELLGAENVKEEVERYADFFDKII